MERLAPRAVSLACTAAKGWVLKDFWPAAPDMPKVYRLVGSFEFRYHILNRSISHIYLEHSRSRNMQPSCAGNLDDFRWCRNPQI